MKKGVIIFYLLPFFILLLPSIHLSLFYSHAVAKVYIIVFTLYFWLIKKIQIANLKKELSILCLFYCIRIILLFPQTNISVFEETAKMLIFYVISIYYLHILEMIFGKRLKKYLIYLFVYISLFDLINNLLLYIFKYEYLRMWQTFLFPGDYAIALMNLNRGRIYLGNYPELIIPFAIIEGGVGYLIVIGLTFFSVLVAGFRTNFVMAIFAFIASLITLKHSLFPRTLSKSIVGVLCIFFIIGFVTLIPQAQTVNRIFNDQTENYATIESRINYIKLGLDLFWANPLIGVGTSTYKDYLPQQTRNLTFSDKNELTVFNNARDPHNFIFTILSEGGIVTLSIFLYMLFVSFKKDLKNINPASIAFWALFLYCLANPVAESLKFNLLFILFRYMI